MNCRTWLLYLHCCCVQLAVVGLFFGLKALGMLISPMVPLVCFLMIWFSWIPLYSLSVAVQHSSSFDETFTVLLFILFCPFGVIMVCFSVVIKIFLLDFPHKMAMFLRLLLLKVLVLRFFKTNSQLPSYPLP